MRKPICPRLFVIAAVTLSNIVCTREQMINGTVEGGGLFLFFVCRQLTQEHLYPVGVKVPRSGQHWAVKEGQKNRENVVTLASSASPASRTGGCGTA